MRVPLLLLVVSCGGTVNGADGGTAEGGVNPPRDGMGRVAVATALGPGPSSGITCDEPVSSLSDPPRAFGIGNVNTLTIRDGDAWQGDALTFGCSVVPNPNGGFDVAGRAEVKGITLAAGTLTVSGTFQPKVNGKAANVPNITAIFRTSNGNFSSS